MKIEICNFVIEVTRQCNLYCEHCLRGDAEPLVVKKEFIESAFKQIRHISTLTISGGEPALYPEKIMEIIELAKYHHVSIDDFHLTTNGTIASNEFMMSIIELYCYCSDNEMSSVNISNDYFHEESWKENFDKLSVLRFVKMRHKKDNYNYDEFRNIIVEGRGIDWDGSKVTEPNADEIKNGNPEEISDNTFYLNCKGNIIAGCDRSYESQDKQENILCNVSNFAKIYNNLAAKYIERTCTHTAKAND